MEKSRIFLISILFPTVLLLQGCEAFIAGTVANAVSIEAQEHAAYADYLFEMQAKNDALKRTGEPPQAIIPRDTWVEDYFWARIRYSDYYIKYTKEKSPVGPLQTFEEWKVAHKNDLDWKKKKQTRSPNDKGIP